MKDKSTKKGETMFKFRLLLITAYFLLLTSCATPYGPRSTMGGYTEEQIDKDSYIVSFYGNGNSSEERVWNFWIYRCAELTKIKGYNYFTIIPIKNTSMLENNDENGSLYEFVALDQQDSIEEILLDNEYSYDPVYYYTYTIRTYSSSARIDMYNAPVSKKVKFLLDANVITKELGEYVKTDGNAKLPERKALLMRAALEAAIKGQKIRLNKKKRS